MTATAAQRAVPVRKATYGRAVKSEWIKARSLRSTWILMGFTLLAFIGIPLLAASPTDSSFASASLLFNGLDFAVILLAIFSALLITSEYTTGSARNTFTATPSRGAVLAAKTTIAVLFALVVTVVAVGVAWAIALPADAAAIDLADTETMRLFGGKLLGLVVVVVLSVSLGTLLRSAVGTIFTILAIELIAPPILLSVGNTIANWVGALLPFTLTSQVIATDPPGAGEVGLASGPALLVLLLWAIIPFVLAVLSLRSRDV
ncbi:hypothetical protein [Demequina sp. NBRC 110056]|uniref:hypothetical protein n=1 Tax=Demequina sp. NBRC 110056 TaxID=1570345 RepID=UPI000A04D1F4|nr:hypothetical protein [Demequina sp. NBRC 110056]